MYNEYQKNRYLDYCRNIYAGSTVDGVLGFFNSSEPVENFYDKDLSEFVEFEIMDLLQKMSSTSRQRLTGMCIFFEKYYDWCLSEGLATNIDNKYRSYATKKLIESAIPKTLLDNKFFSKNIMIEYIDSVYDPVNKFIMYALYRSVKGENYEELVNLKIGDLDRENKTLSLITGRTIKVDDLFIELMDNANNSTAYYKDESHENSHAYNYSDYIESEYVLKQLVRGKPEPVNITTIYQRLLLLKKQAGNKSLSAPVIYKNGMVNYIMEQYADRNISLRDAMFQKINGKEYVYENETEGYIEEFGSKLTVRMLRREINEFIDCYE